MAYYQWINLCLNDNVIIGTVDHIKIVNLTSLAIKQEINIEQYKGVYSMIYIEKGIYFCGTAIGKLLIYDINSNKINQEVQYHKDTVASMLLVNKHFFYQVHLISLKYGASNINKDYLTYVNIIILCI